MIRLAINRYSKRFISLDSKIMTRFEKRPLLSLVSSQHLPEKESKSRDWCSPMGFLLLLIQANNIYGENKVSEWNMERLGAGFA